MNFSNTQKQIGAFLLYIIGLAFVASIVAFVNYGIVLLLGNAVELNSHTIGYMYATALFGIAVMAYPIIALLDTLEPFYICGLILLACLGWALSTALLWTALGL